MNALPPKSNAAILSVRVNAQERELLSAAAEQARTTLSDFIRRKALEAAEFEVMDRRVIEIPAEDWEKFESWVNSPAEPIPALRQLMTTKPAWES